MLNNILTMKIVDKKILINRACQDVEQYLDHEDLWQEDIASKEQNQVHSLLQVFSLHSHWRTGTMWLQGGEVILQDEADLETLAKLAGVSRSYRPHRGNGCQPNSYQFTHAGVNRA